MINKENHQLILDVAVKYYLEDKTQNQIAHDLFISRSKVSRLLKLARENEIVKISINYQSDEFSILKNQICQMFNVKEIFITKTCDSDATTLREVGKLAAIELERQIHNGISLGISWGRHVGMMAKYLNKHDYKNIRIVEAFGANNVFSNHIDQIGAGRIICDKLNAYYYPMPAPIHIFDPKGREEVLNSEVVKDTINRIEECDLIVSSIGTVEDDKLQILWQKYLNDELRKEVLEHKGVGFILARFFDKNGMFIDSKINDSVIGISTEKIAGKKIFAIASGLKKSRPILAALKVGLLDTLVTDEDTIRRVIELADENN